MSFIEWRDQYSVGVAVFDEDHKKLVELFNTLHEAIRTSAGPSTIKPILSELLDYTSYHFGREEKLMAEISYPGLGTQKEAHRKFVAKVQEIVKA